MLLSPPLDRDSAVPLYRQLYRHIRGAVLSGDLPPGAQMPSKRALAGMCGLSLITVETAYAQLLAEGYLLSRPRRGTFVASSDLRPDAQEVVRNAERMPDTGETPNAPPPPLYDCHFGRIDAAAFPAALWRRLVRESFESIGPELLSRGNPQGEYALRREIARYLFRLRGVRCAPDQIVVGAGVEWLLLALLPLLDRDAVFGIEEPGYTPYRRLLRDFGRETAPLAVDEEGALPRSARESGADVVYLSPSHQFPLGSVLSFSRRREWLSWAAEAPARYVIEDDYDSEFRYRGLPIPSLQSLDEHGRVVYVGTFSKSLAPGLRIAYMAMPPGLLALRRERRGAPASGVSRVDQAALALFMSGGHFERHIHRMRLIYRKKREKLLALLKPFRPGLLTEDDGAGVFLRLYVQNGMTERALLESAGARGIALTGLSRFYAAPPPAPPGVLLGFGGLDEKTFPELARLLAEVWNFPVGFSI